MTTQAISDRLVALALSKSTEDLLTISDRQGIRTMSSVSMHRHTMLGHGPPKGPQPDPRRSRRLRCRRTMSHRIKPNLQVLPRRPNSLHPTPPRSRCRAHHLNPPDRSMIERAQVAADRLLR
jgi:hypothetical protein